MRPCSERRAVGQDAGGVMSTPPELTEPETGCEAWPSSELRGVREHAKDSDGCEDDKKGAAVRGPL